jgi:preprotein translocase subunit YajC
VPAFIFILVVLVLLWFLLIRPRQRQLRKQQSEVARLEVGDEILTAGGIYGTVTAVDGDEVLVRIAPELEVRVARRAVAGVLTEKGEPSELEPPGEPGEEGG